jgi:hypothetical protein
MYPSEPYFMAFHITFIHELGDLHYWLVLTEGGYCKSRDIVLNAFTFNNYDAAIQ